MFRWEIAPFTTGFWERRALRSLGWWWASWCSSLHSCLHRVKSSPNSLYWFIHTGYFPVSAPICIKAICCWGGTCKLLSARALMWWDQLHFTSSPFFTCLSLFPHVLGAPCSCSAGSFLELQCQPCLNPDGFLALRCSGKHWQESGKPPQVLSTWWLEKPLNSSRSPGASLPEMLGNKKALFLCQDGFLVNDEGRKVFLLVCF